MLVLVTPIDIPGLFEVQLPDGRTYSNLTVREVGALARREGWRIELAA